MHNAWLQEFSARTPIPQVPCSSCQYTQTTRGSCRHVLSQTGIQHWQHLPSNIHPTQANKHTRNASPSRMHVIKRFATSLLSKYFSRRSPGRRKSYAHAQKGVSPSATRNLAACCVAAWSCMVTCIQACIAAFTLQGCIFFTPQLVNVLAV